MNNFRVFKTIHFPDTWGQSITAMHHKQNNTTKGTYLYYGVVNMNNDPKHNFYIIGLLDEQVIASCIVTTYLNYDKDIEINNYDEFLISSLIVDKEYQRQGYGTIFLDSVMKILKEENATKICAFACDNSKKLFENFKFRKDETIKSFGITFPGDDNDVYYELILESNFFMAPLNKDDVRFISISKHNEFWNYFKEEDNIPFSLIPTVSMYQSEIFNEANYENALVKTVRCNRMVAGYAYIFYHDYDNEFGESDHAVYIRFYLDNKYLYRSAIKVIVEEAKKFYQLQKENHNIKNIKVCLNKWTILMKRYDFYKRSLLELGFIKIDNELFIKTIE